MRARAEAYDARRGSQATRDAARGHDVWLAGGASTVNQYLVAGTVDEIDVSIAPVILGHRERLFQVLEPGRLKLTQVGAVDAPGATHIKYRSADRTPAARSIPVISSRTHERPSNAGPFERARRDSNP